MYFCEEIPLEKLASQNECRGTVRTTLCSTGRAFLGSDCLTALCSEGAGFVRGSAQEGAWEEGRWSPLGAPCSSLGLHAWSVSRRTAPAAVEVTAGDGASRVECVCLALSGGEFDRVMWDTLFCPCCLCASFWGGSPLSRSPNTFPSNSSAVP